MATLSSIIPASPGTYIRTSFTATGGQTTFSAVYSPRFVEVFLNGVLLNDSDYTATNGTTVVLSAGATVNDIIETIAYRVTDITTASSAVSATNLDGGAASRIPFQTGIGSTAFIANGNSGEVLISAGTSAPAFGVLGVSGGGTGTTSTTFANLTTNVTGTLPVANGGTGITSLGANVASFLATPTSVILSTVVSDETGSGNLVFASNPILNTPTLDSASLVNFGSIRGIFETGNVVASAPGANVQMNLGLSAVQYFTSSAAANFTVNFRANSTASLNSVMNTGNTVTAAVIVTNGATAYYPTVYQVDGAVITPKWQGGTAPTQGNASSTDTYVFTIVKTGSAAFTMLASQTKFA